jgi:hypothetical protein
MKDFFPGDAILPQKTQRGAAATKKEEVWITNCTNETNYTNAGSRVSFPRKRESIFETMTYLIRKIGDTMPHRVPDFLDS